MGLTDLPTTLQLERAARAFDTSWGGVDEVLYGICREHPGHAGRREVTKKVALIDRAYSAGLERQVIPDAGNQAITKIADFVVDCGPEVDALIEELAPVQEPLCGETMVAIVRVHGCFLDLLRRIPTRGTSPRSFAAKYLHFHKPVVPIFDSYAAARVRMLVPRDTKQRPFEQPAGSDDEYYDFCARFFCLYDACQEAGRDVTVKGLDAYLWQVPV